MLWLHSTGPVGEPEGLGLAWASECVCGGFDIHWHILHLVPRCEIVGAFSEQGP